MAVYNISKIITPSGDEHLLRHHEVLDSRTFTDVIATSNDDNGASFFCLKVRPIAYKEIWYVKVRISASIPGNDNYRSVSISEIWNTEDKYISYKNTCAMQNAGYRPIRYVTAFYTNSIGYENNCGHWIGFSLKYSENPLNTSYKRTIIFDILDYYGCEIELSDTLITPDDIPNRADHAEWYTSTRTAVSMREISSSGIHFAGDEDTTMICTLYHGSEKHTAKNVIYRNQLLFSVNENVVTTLNVDNNITDTTKTMLVNEKFNPLGNIYYYNTSTTTTQGSSFDFGSSILYSSSWINLQYTFNISNDGSRTIGSMLYIKVALQSDGLCKLSSADPLTQTLPSSEDGYLYISLGIVNGWNTTTLHPTHPVYFYRDGVIVRYTGSKEQLDWLLHNTVYNPSGATLAEVLSDIDSRIGDSGVQHVYIGYSVAHDVLGLESSCSGTLIANSANYRTLTLYPINNTKIYTITKNNGTWESVFSSVPVADVATASDVYSYFGITTP